MSKEKDEILGVGMLKNDIRALIRETILTASENFIQFHGGRDVGKSYTTQLTCLDYAIANHRELMLTVPTLRQRDDGALANWMAKVLDQQFPEWYVKRTTKALYMRKLEEDDWQRVATCWALSDAENQKTDSSVHATDFMIWDESMRINLDAGTADTLIELFLTAYHTVDREENRVKAIFLGNALNKTDPLYQFFGVGISDLKKQGKIVRGFNKLSWYVPIPPDIKDNPDNKFRQMLRGTKYGDMADGKFDLNYGYLIGDPGDNPVTTCLGVEFTESGYLLIMMSERTVYIQACEKEFAEKYATRIYTTNFKQATNDRPLVPQGVLTTVRLALAAGRCKFVDEESLLTGASRLKALWNIAVL